MGVADKITYRDMYHFNPNFYSKTASKDQPSIKVDEKDVKDGIKTNPYRSNVEIEKDELVLNPDLSALFKARGKKHSQGGIDVMLKPESFIFSDDKTLAFSEDDHELLELKAGGKVKTSTPADVIRKNIDVKHYNRLVQNINDPLKDELAKKSSIMMLEKYIKTLGNVAFLQEAKKNFPEGTPSFFQGLPPKNEDLEGQINMQKQYSKYGGRILPKAQLGSNGLPQLPLTTYKNKDDWDWVWDKSGHLVPVPKQAKAPTAPTDNGDNIPDGYFGPDIYDLQEQRKKAKQNPYAPNTSWDLWHGDKYNNFQKNNKVDFSNAADKMGIDLNKTAQELGYNGPKNTKAFQEWLYKSSPENAAVIDKWHNTYSNGPTGGKFDGKIGVRWANALKDITNQKQRVPTSGINPGPINPLSRMPGNQIQRPPVDETIIPNPVDGQEQKGLEANWDFTPWQKLGMGYDAYKLLAAKRYMPYRTQVNMRTVNPYLQNPENSINDIKAAGNMQMNASRTLNPIIANAQNSAVAADIMNKMPQIRGQYDNQNAQIMNQNNMANAQILNNEETLNKQFDQNYYQQSIAGQANYDNMKSFLRDQMMSNMFKNVKDNQSLAYAQLQQDNPVYSYDFKHDRFKRNPMNIKDVQTGTAQGDLQSQWMNQIISDPALDIKDKINILKIMTVKGFQPTRNQKKGGKINPYK